MRIYELSKELNIPSKQLIEALQSEGVSVKSHMSSIGQNEVSLLRKKFTQQPEPSKQQDPKKISKDVMQKEPVKSPSVAPVAPRKEKVTRPKAPTLKKKPVERVAPEPHVEQAPSSIVIEPLSVGQAAERLGKPVTEVILTLLKWGVVAAKNQLLTEEIVSRLAKHYEVAVSKKEEVKRDFVPLEKEGKGELEERLPVVVVLGHVDHGKTTLLDFIRSTRVVSREKGGITQHLGAYKATTKHGDLVFLDTPGHEAFPKMRQRGIRVADIGILVVAADDGIMPQTLEAIEHLKSMDVPIVVAINKMDKVDPTRLETIKRQLAEQDLLPEEWGGQVVCIPISALEGTGVDQLLEMVSLQAEMLELKASQEGFAHCYVLESKLERGRGAVATLICQHGSLKVGDYFTCGKTSGRVSSIKDSSGKNLNQVGPSVPVSIAGFKDLPEAGDMFNAIAKADVRKALQQQAQQASSNSRRVQEGNINIVVKADTNSSKEALIDALYKLSKKSDVGINVIHSGVGDISESDIELAYSTGSLVIGLHTKSESNALSLAQRRGITVELYDIIYKLLEAVQEKLENAKEVEMVKEKIGDAVVRAVFDIKGVGVVAGSYVQDGRFAREGYVVAWRGKEKLGEGKITSLQREKKTVKEVHSGYECGFVVEGITDWQVDDRAECFIEVPKK